MEDVEAEIFEPFELHFSDLLVLSSSTFSCSSFPKEEQGRLESIVTTIMKTLGPSGPGLLTITGVPKAPELRRNLLPLARKLALLNNEDRRRILKEHGLGSDVSLKNPDRTVSSFALPLKYIKNPSYDKHEDHSEEHLHHLNRDHIHESTDCGFNNLGKTFNELGLCMVELGLQLARVCDRAIGGNDIEQSILDSSNAKGRLIHYHSTLDNLLLKESGKKIKGLRKNAVSTSTEAINKDPNEAKSCRTSLTNLWQQWHYDYGIFTVMTNPMFIYSEDDHFPPSAHTYLQIFDSNKNRILLVRSLPDSFIIQVGESADIISQGKLHSTLHSVSRPVNLNNLSRETFVVFLQPAWDKVFSTPNSDSGLHYTEQPPDGVYRKIQEIVPPLSSRLKNGMTFAEFSRETTKQYYGSSGMQSNRSNQLNSLLKTSNTS